MTTNSPPGIDHCDPRGNTPFRNKFSVLLFVTLGLVVAAIAPLADITVTAAPADTPITARNPRRSRLFDICMGEKYRLESDATRENLRSVRLLLEIRSGMGMKTANIAGAERSAGFDRAAPGWEGDPELGVK